MLLGSSRFIHTTFEQKVTIYERNKSYSSIHRHTDMILYFKVYNIQV